MSGGDGDVKGLEVVGEGAHGVGHVYGGDGGGGGADGGRRAARQGGASRGPRGVPVHVKNMLFFRVADPDPDSIGSVNPDPDPDPGG
jgi:hypothetical protein